MKKFQEIFLGMRDGQGFGSFGTKPSSPSIMVAHWKHIASTLLLLCLSVGQMWANGGIGYKGVKFTKNGSATGWYNIHNVSWSYYNSTYDCRSGQSGVTDFNNANLGTVTTLKLKAFVVIGWTDNTDYVAGQLKYRLYKQSASAPSYSTYSVGNYGSSSNSSSAANVLVSSGNDRVVGNASLTTDIVTSSTAAGNYYLQLQGLGRMQWSNGSSHGSFNENNGSEVKATLLVPGFETTSTSHAFGSVNVGSNSSTTKSFTQHYGTALTTSNCAITGTNSGDFSVTSISETGVTIRFAPSSAGSKSATLTITDANSKTCTITLTGTGTTPPGLTVIAGTGISAVTGSDADISAGDKIAITATVATGYTWDRWTLTGSGTLSTFTATTKDQTVTVGTAGSMTLTASATETSRTITIVNGTASNTTAGVVTQGTATAATPAAGKKFTGWTLGTGVSLVGGYALTDQTIKFTASQNSTVTANYADRASVKMYFAKPLVWGASTLYVHTFKNGGGVSPNAAYPGVTCSTTEIINCITYYTYQYYTEGDGIGGAATGNAAWDRVIFGCNTDAKKTGDLTISNGHYYYWNSSTTGAASAVTDVWYIKGTMNSWGETHPIVLDCANNKGTVNIDLTKDNTYEFKVYDVINTYMWSNSTACGTSSGDHTITATMASAETLYSNDDNVMKIRASVTGPYTFEVSNINTTSPKIKVTFPTSYTLTYSIGTVAGNNGSISTSPTTASGSKVLSGNTVTLTGPAAKSGYSWKGWYTDAGGTTGKITDTNRAITVTMNADKTLYACYTANSYTVTLNKQTSATGYGTSGTCGNQTVTYNATPTAITKSTLPTGSEGYGFMGFYTETAGSGLQVIDAEGHWNSNVSGYLTSGKWTHDGNVTLYAYYKKAEIVNLDINPSLTEKGGTVEVTPEIEPEPTGTTSVCYYLLYTNGNKVDPQPEFSIVSGNTVSFTAPSSAGTFIVAAALRTGSSCGGGTLLDSVATHTFQVGGEYSVTVKYMRDNVAIKPQTKVAANPSAWTEITAPDIIGYSFSKWKAGDGVTIEGAASGESTSPTINFQASYDGTLTALYTKKRFIYFNNTNTNWSSVNVYFYKNNSYWDNAKGTGSDPTYTYTNTPYSEELHGAMTRIEGTNVWYFDCEAAGVPDTYKDVAFTEAGQNRYGFFSYKSGTTPNNVSRRGDFNNTLPMFVPISQDGVSLNNGQAKYSSEGYWMNYPENTGYSIRLFNKISGDGTYEVDSIPVEFTEDYTLAEPINVLMDAGHTYGFKLFRADNVWMGNTGTMTNGASGDEGQTAWEFRQKNDDSSDKPNCGLTTTAAGTYTFSVSFGKKGSYYDYFVGVHYPVVAGDFQILYHDNAEWSQGSTHGTGWVHPSRTITARSNGVDTISFFVAKGTGISASLKARKVNSITAGTGAITWGSLYIAGETSKSLTVDSAAVYNFKVTQSSTAGTIASIENIGAYTGDYYIRCNAMNNKWGNFRDDHDHLMTYSAFSEDRSQNGFGDLFSHYKAKWCPRSTNVKFCIANDYSLCISDTLIKDVTGSWPDNMDATGTLNSDGSADVTADKWSANIRFMWNRKTNKISRAYVASSTNTTRRFLVLHGCDDYIHDHNNNEIPATSYLAANEVLLEDDQNWIYETTIKAQPTARVKLYACYGENPANVATAQYFRGAYDSGSCGSSTNSIQILGGSGSTYYLMRVIYDFKTNRLITAWLPDGTPVDQAPLNIDADVMVIRDHQQAAEAITFTNSTKSLGNVKTVYGTIRFNRWTLNNRYRSSDTYNPSFVPSTTETDVDKEHSKNAEAISRYHAPLPPHLQTSSFERNNYFISFPFDVQLSEVFGFGTYGTHWIISKYNGLRRAQVGYFRDNCINGDFDCTNWDYIWDRTGVTLKAYEGYLLSLDLDLMQYDDTTNFWLNQIHQVELYFPSKVPMGQITTTNVTLPALGNEYLCTKNYNTDGTNPEGDRRVKDSYWRCIGVPSYAPYGTVLKTGETEIQWNSDYTWYEDQRSFPFLYEWNTTDNTLTPQRTKTFNFKPLHSYLVQNKNTITWTAVSATPAAPVAARMHDEDVKELTWRLTLTGNADDESDTYIRMTNDEDVTPGFDFGPDLIKKFRDGYILDAKGDPIWDSSIDDYKQGVLHSDIYSLIGYEYLAANSLPLNTTSNTIVPIGVRTKVAGDFTFAMPDGTHGVGITLVDQVNGIRTNLSTGLSYTTALEKGQFDKRFYLEISPVQQTPTGLEPTTDSSLKGREVRKVLIDGILYIVRDGKIFDARGARVE